MKTKPSSTTPETANQLYAMAFRFYESGKYREAVHFFRVLTSMNTDERKFWIGLGASLQMLRDYENALPAYGIAALLDENDPQVHLYAAECFIALQRIEEARTAMAMAEQHCVDSIEHDDLRSQLALMRAECDTCK